MNQVLIGGIFISLIISLICVIMIVRINHQVLKLDEDDIMVNELSDHVKKYVIISLVTTLSMFLFLLAWLFIK